jgi:NAD(P)-dependent dehydrogenase (short-subunit alcohol dehydrogenase family)
MVQNQRLEGKRALVTGSGTGIGREVALEFARQGADVVLHYAHSAQGAERAVTEIEAMGRRSTAVQVDLSDAQACFDLVDDAVAFLGRLDVLVNNAGISASEEFLKVTPEHFDRLLRVNFQGQFFCAQRAARYMVEQGDGGCVINMTSSHAVSSLPGFSVYAGTKGALWSWTQQLAVELAPLGIRVNGLCPGWIVVESHFQKVPDFDPASISPHIPYRRMGCPLDIARACAFLASEDSDYVIGHVLVVDGGTLAKLALPEHGKEEEG